MLCMEKLSQIITCRVKAKECKGAKIAKNCPTISHVFFANDIILLSKATEEQAYIMKEYMEAFCRILGQQISYEKSLVFCSKNVNKAIANSIATIYGSPLTANLGRYLRLPLIHQRISHNTYLVTLDNMKKRLTSWKSKKLTTARRLVLINSMLNFILIYTMNTVKLPSLIRKEIDKVNIDFLWYSNCEKKKKLVHLVKWESVCKKKKDGGLGITMASLMNQALVPKLG